MSKQSWRDVVPVHPAAEVFPMMSEPDLLELGENIKAFRLVHPIVVTDTGDLIDGRNRLAAMELVGLPTTGVAKVTTDEDPYEYVISANAHRRHLTGTQMRTAIAKVLKAKPTASNNSLAKQIGASDKTVASVRSELTARSEIPNVERTDTKGRRVPERKPKTHLSVVEPSEKKKPTGTWPPEQPVAAKTTEKPKSTRPPESEPVKVRAKRVRDETTSFLRVLKATKKDVPLLTYLTDRDNDRLDEAQDLLRDISEEQARESGKPGRWLMDPEIPDAVLIMQAVNDALADGDWHPLADVQYEAANLVPPDMAVRAWAATRDRYSYGNQSEDMAYEEGRRKIVEYVIEHRVADGEIGRDGERIRLSQTHEDSTPPSSS